MASIFEYSEEFNCFECHLHKKLNMRSQERLITLFKGAAFKENSGAPRKELWGTSKISSHNSECVDEILMAWHCWLRQEVKFFKNWTTHTKACLKTMVYCIGVTRSSSKMQSAVGLPSETQRQILLVYTFQ